MVAPVRATPLGHAGVLVEVGGLVLLVDPVLGGAVGPSVGKLQLGPRRLKPSPTRPEDLPAPHAVLLSHAHWDHTDLPTLRRLPAAATAIVQRGNEDLVSRFPTRTALAWGEATLLEREGCPALRVASTPARHWGARMVVDRWRGWGGFLIEADDIPSPFDKGRPLAILFAGDTAQTDAYARLREQRQGRGVDLAIMPIGGYDPWIFNHCSPEQAWGMGFRDLGARRIMPIHYGTFRLSREREGEPLERLHDAARADRAEDAICGLGLGVAFSLC